MNKVIEVNQLVKTFGRPPNLFHPTSREVKALKNISIDLYEGETLAIVGESGSGKSTLARILVGLEQETSGEIRILGKTVLSGKKRNTSLRSSYPICFPRSCCIIEPT